MTKAIKLQSFQRGKDNGSASKVRQQGFIPANLYGAGVTNKNLKIKIQEFENVFSQAGESNLIDLIVDKAEPVKVIIKEIQNDITSERPIHVDFYQVDMKQKLTAQIPLVFTGEPRAVKELGGILIKAKNEIEVECLPGDLINEIVVDVSGLNEFNDMVMVKDLDLPSEVEFIGDKDDVIASVQAPRVVDEKEEAEEGEEEGAEVEEEGAETKTEETGDTGTDKKEAKE
jgi:large subunit ribosomal protein L25